MPSVVSMRNWCASTYQRLSALQSRREGGEREQRAAPCRSGDDVGLDRLEPALEAAVQGVVFDRLPVRALRHESDLGAVDDEAGVTAAPVAAAVPQVRIRRQRVPRRPQRVELDRAGAGEAREVGRREHGVAAFRERSGKAVDGSRRRARSGRAHPPRRARASAAPWPSAASLASATSRRIGARPQLVHGNRRSAGT